MRRIVPLALLAMAVVPGCASAGVGGFDYAPQYDFAEFFAATDHKTFQVIVSGNPFAGLSDAEMQRRLLPVLQLNRPRPRLTFTYSPPAEEPHPWYRLVLVFDPANDLTAARICRNQLRHKQAVPGRVALTAVYCRNDEALSQAVASSRGQAPEDREVMQMFHDLFLVLFTDQPPLWQQRSRFPFVLR